MIGRIYVATFGVDGLKEEFLEIHWLNPRQLTT